MKTVVRWSNNNLQIENNRGDQIGGAVKADKHGFTPIELLTGSLGQCIIISISKILKRDGILFTEDSLHVTVDALKAEKGLPRVDQFIINIEVFLELDEKYRKKLIKSAERACTIGNTLKQGTTITYIDGGKINERK